VGGLRLIQGGADDAPRFVDPAPELPERLRRDDERGYVARVLQQQAEAGATLLVPPYHLAGDLADAGRQRDLRLARIAVRQFREARLGERGRSLWAALAVAPETVRDPLARAGLVTAYAAVEADGFVVKVERLADEVEAAAELLFSLQLQSGRPVAALGAGELEPALVAEGLASVNGVSGAGRDDAVARAAARVRRRAQQVL
jgi:hypothetical protein